MLAFLRFDSLAVFLETSWNTGSFFTGKLFYWKLFYWKLFVYTFQKP